MKKAALLISALMIFSVMSGCSNNTQSENSDESKSNDSSKTTEEFDTRNILTGQEGLSEKAIGKRPVAIMVNNLIGSLPQYGIGAADLIYEMPVEGGITRLMAVYGDYTQIPDVCSVRSSRYYYPIIANGLDAIYCHWGSDKTVASDTLDRLEIERFDGYSANLTYDLFSRDKDRMDYFPLEHTAYIKGPKIPDAIEEAGYRSDLKNSVDNMAFDFYKQGEEIILPDEKAENIGLAFSKSYYSDFSYDKDSKTYLKMHSGDKHIDSSTGEQLAFTNVIILKTDISLMANSNKLMDVQLSKGKGYYISNGRYQEIIWELQSENYPIKLFDVDGGPINVITGKSYIGIINSENTITIE